MPIFLIIACILFLFSILEASVFGGKYARWWFRQFSRGYKDYDLKKFRLIRGASLGIAFILVFLMGFCKFMHFGIYLTTSLAVIILHYYIILHNCKKSNR